MERQVYAKVNEKVVEAVGRSEWHPRTSDGNYLVFITELKRIDRDVFAHRAETAAAIGAVMLTDPEAAQEQKGTVVRPLPVATDPRFRISGNSGSDVPDVGGESAEEESEAGSGPDSPDSPATSDISGPPSDSDDPNPSDSSDSATAIGEGGGL